MTNLTGNDADHMVGGVHHNQVAERQGAEHDVGALDGEGVQDGWGGCVHEIAEVNCIICGAGQDRFQAGLVASIMDVRQSCWEECAPEHCWIVKSASMGIILRVLAAVPWPSWYHWQQTVATGDKGWWGRPVVPLEIPRGRSPVELWLPLRCRIPSGESSPLRAAVANVTEGAASMRTGMS